MFETLPGVERALHIVKPYKLVAREWHKASTVVRVRGIEIGGPAIQMIAGPARSRRRRRCARRPTRWRRAARG